MPRNPHDSFKYQDRPSKKGSRPRTKTRPEHKDAVTGFVTGVDRGRYTVLVAKDQNITAVKAKDLRKERIVCGDQVDLVGDVSGNPDTLARIVRIQERTTVLRRTADDNDPYERIIVANAQQLVIVVALADPTPRTGMIDRCLVAGFSAGMDTVLCLTKADLAPADELIELYEPLGVQVVVTQPNSAAKSPGIVELENLLTGKISVFVGHSGVGKSTLVNRLTPKAQRTTGKVNTVTGRGRHTSTSAVVIKVPHLADTWVIDTPGVRSFGLAHITNDDVIKGFTDLSEVIEQCPRGCTHLENAPDCGLDDWLKEMSSDQVESAKLRVISLRRILTAKS